MGNMIINDAGADTTATVGVDLLLVASVSDGGLPNPPGFTTMDWTQVSGPGTRHFANNRVVNVTVNFNATRS
jgi:hypothetical protein